MNRIKFVGFARPAEFLRHRLASVAPPRRGWSGYVPAQPEQPVRPSVPKAGRMGIRRLSEDGQRHLRHGAGGGDAAIGLAVGVVLAAVLDLKVQPRAPALAAHFAAVGFAGQVHPGAGAVLEPVAVGAERLVYVQAEALGAAALGQRYLE